MTAADRRGDDRGFVDAVAAFIEHHQLVRPGERILVAVSGGPDSVALLLALVDLQPRLAIDLHVVHFNHELRGAESDADEAFVLDLARRLGLPASVGRADVRRLSQEQRRSLEAVARQARYAYFRSLAEQVGAAAVATGHQADDQVETVLLHLLRGTGPAGLQGMRPRGVLRLDGGALVVIRPLLAVTHQAAVAFCQARGITPRVDVTNFSTDYLRNRIRLALLPVLETFNPRIRQAIRQLADLQADDLAIVEAAVAEVWPMVARVEAGEVRLAKATLAALPLGLQRHVIRRAIGELLGDLVDINATHLAAILAARDRPAGTQIALPRRLVFTVGYVDDLLTIGPPEPALPPLTGSHRLVVPGETVLPGWTVRAAVLERRDWLPTTGNAYSACFDLAKTGVDLVVRTRRPGDRFQPLGMTTLKKLQDFFVDAKVPRAWRDRVPLVCAGDAIVWVVGWRIDQRFAIGPATTRVLCLDFNQHG